MKSSTLGCIAGVSIALHSLAGEGPLGEWTLGKGMPTQRSEIAAAVVDGRIYIPGGVSLRGSLSCFEAYDPETDRWTRLPDLPTKLNHVGVASHGSFLYVSGGFVDLRQEKVSDSLYRYDTVHRSWEKISALPRPRAKHFMIQRDGWLHLIGGLDHREIDSYHLPSGMWDSGKLPPLPGLRDHISVLQDSRSIYIVGGRKDREGEQSACLAHEEGDHDWRVFTHLPLARGGQTATLHQGRIHVLGGEDLQSHETFRRHDIYDLRSRRWKKAPPMKRSRHGMASSQFEGKWYVIGGGQRSATATLFSTTRRVEILELP